MTLHLLNLNVRKLERNLNRFFSFSSLASVLEEDYMATLIFMDTDMSRLKDRIDEFVSEHEIVNARQYIRQDDSGTFRRLIAMDYEED